MVARRQRGLCAVGTRFGVMIVRKALLGMLLLSVAVSGLGCHELGRLERWKNEQLFGRSTCLPHHGADDECCDDEGAPAFIDGPVEGPVYVE